MARSECGYRAPGPHKFLRIYCPVRPMKPATPITLLLSLALWLIPAWGQSPPSDLRNWELICYCSGREKSADEIVREDTNGQILFAARRGTTRQHLKEAHIEFTESQIDLLVSWRLLADQDGQLKTQMPILGPDEMPRLRALLHVQAVELGGSLLPDIKALVSLLNQRGYGDEAYTVVFLIFSTTWYGTTLTSSTFFPPWRSLRITPSGAERSGRFTPNGRLLGRTQGPTVVGSCG